MAGERQAPFHCQHCGRTVSHRHRQAQEILRDMHLNKWCVKDDKEKT